jgi:peptidoglycan L-alanyl-D-glutamate endopeptidase CwlK
VRRFARAFDWLMIGGAMAVAIASMLRAQTVQLTPLSPALPKPCWPSAMLTGKDTAWLYVPCRSLDVLAPGFRAPLECMLARQRKGGWSPLVQETMRSDALQRRYYAKGRTAPGPRVTNAKGVQTTVHGYGLAADVISAIDGWKNPRFFYWQGQHAEACGLVAGAFWTRLPDAPHVQIGAWAGAPPLWARALHADSLRVVWLRVK